MKTLALLVFLAGTSAAMADANLLQNGDFSSGIAHWDGNCRSLDTAASDSPFSTAPTTGVAVKLRHFDWTQVTQDFDGKIGQYLLTVTYSVSSDLKFSDKPDDYVNVPGKLGYTLLRPFNSEPGKWDLILIDIGANHYNYWKITPKVDASSTQIVTVNVQLDSDDTQKKGFCLVFPPGQGVINLQSISLVPKP
jgi:hypothetical protein